MKYVQSGVSSGAFEPIVDFEQVNAGWVIIYFMSFSEVICVVLINVIIFFIFVLVY